MGVRRTLKAKIGELLIERNLITEEQLEKALKAQKENGGYISQHLISLGFVSEVNIAECLACQYSFAYLPLANYVINPEVLEIIPFKFVDMYSILPVDKIEDVLSVVMADPLNEGVIDMLKQITGCEVQVLISTYTQIRRAIENYFSKEIRNARQDKLDENKILKEEILKSFIQVKNLSEGIERRKHERKECKLDLVYFFQDKCYKAKLENISYGGISFVSDILIPMEKTVYVNIVCNILAENMTINAVVQVVRVEKIEELYSVSLPEATPQKYSISGFFSFIVDDDRKKLATLLQ